MDSSALQVLPKGRALSESYYYQGYSADGGLAFTLQHNVLKRRYSKTVRIEVALMAYDRKSGEVQCIYDREEVTLLAYQQFARRESWLGSSFNFASGSFFAIESGRLRGKLHTPRGSAAWDIQLSAGDSGFMHLLNEAAYRLPLPSRKFLTCDTRLHMRGRISCAGMVLQGEFHGVHAHSWGRGQAHEFAHASCGHFRERDDAYFDGFSARLQLLGSWVQSPCLSMASLRLGEQWFHFNHLLPSIGHSVDALDNYRWLLTLSNRTHCLEVAIDGANPRVEPWLALHHDQPGGQRTVMKSTVFAAGRLSLYVLGDDKPLQTLSSEAFALETSLASNLPISKGYVGIP